MSVWVPPTRPLNVWKIIFQKRYKDHMPAPVPRFSLQDTLKGDCTGDYRGQEVMNFLMKHQVARDPLYQSLNIINDPLALEDCRRAFSFIMRQNLCAGIYRFGDRDTTENLVAVDLLFVMTEDVRDDLERLKDSFKSEKVVKIWDIYDDLTAQEDPFRRFKVDKYIDSRALCVDPKYERWNFENHLLDARYNIGMKYGIDVTSSVFTFEAAQKEAERLGFVEQFSADYARLIDFEGNTMFSAGKEKCAKLMMRRLFCNKIYPSPIPKSILSNSTTSGSSSTSPTSG